MVRQHADCGAYVAPPTGSPLFTSPHDEVRARRPTDTALAIASLIVLVADGHAAAGRRSVRRGGGRRAGDVCGFLDALWRVAVWVLLACDVVLDIAALVRRRWPLDRDVGFAELAAVVVAVLAGEFVLHDGRAVLRDLAGTAPPHLNVSPAAR